jgi:16S rRNA (guanine(966)-N(2))-methyltransferase RsmD
LRIIAGKYRSRKINYGSEPPRKKNGVSVYRPTTDRAKESLFNILNNMIDFDSIVCLDLFAGSGALGFEAISRGAASCDFVEISFKQLRQIQRTADELGVAGIVNIHQSDVFDFLVSCNIESYDLVFADPPYDFNKYDQLFRLVSQKLGGIFVIEHSGDMSFLYDTKRFEQAGKKIGITQFKIFSAKA